MAQALFYSMKDLKRFSSLSGNIDDDKLLQFAKIAHDIHIQNYLGTDLFNRLEAGIIASDLTANETSLLNDYVKDMAIHWTLVEAIDALAFTISNKGVFKHTSEDSESATKEDIDWIVNKHRGRAQYYTNRFIEYMCENGSTFPEYSSNTNSDVKPSKSSYTEGGWVI